MFIWKESALPGAGFFRVARTIRRHHQCARHTCLSCVLRTDISAVLDRELSICSVGTETGIVILLECNQMASDPLWVFALGTSPPVTAVSRALWARNAEKVSKMSPAASGPGPRKSLQKVSGTVGKISARKCPESVFGLFPRLFGDFFGVPGRRLRETFSRFRARRARETPVAQRAPRSKKINPDRKFQSRLKSSISLEKFNPGASEFPTKKTGVWRVARLKISIPLEFKFSIPEGHLEFFQPLGP